MPEMKMVYTPCQGWACHERCILSTFVNEDGVIDHCEKMVLPEELRDDSNPHSIAARACICQKGALAGKVPYMEGRLTHPLKRVGERGENKFERISWDQALDEIAEKLNEIRAKYGKGSVLVNTFCCGYAGYPAPLGYSIGQRFLFATGASGFEPEGIDVGIIQAPNMMWGNNLISMFMDTQNLAFADYLVVWGGNPLGYTRAGHTTKTMMRKMHDDGVKLVDVGILFDSTAAKADEFLRVNPASDLALALSIVRYIIEEGYVDEAFVSESTVAPFLVRTDTGKFLRESDIVEGGSAEKYGFWDKNTGSLRFAVPSERSFGEAQADLYASCEAAGTVCKTALQLLKEHVAAYTFEAQEATTGVPAEQAERIAYEYCTHPQAGMWLGAGLRYKNSTAAVRAILMLPMLTGKLVNDASGVVIECVGDGTMVGFNLAPVFIGGIENPFCHLATMKEIIESPAHPERQQYKAFINLFANPVHNWPSRSLWEDEFFPNMELVVVSEIRETETTAFADYVLPDLTVFEREDVYVSGSHLVYSEPAIEPVGEARDLGAVLIDLAHRMGEGQYFPYTAMEYKEMRLQGEDPQISTLEPPLCYERMRKEKIVRLNDSGKSYHIFRQEKPSTPTARWEFYMETLAHVEGGALPCPTPAIIDDAQAREKHPLHLFVGRSRWFAQGQFREIPELRKLSGDGPRLGMCKEDALARGIREGDLVEVFNDKGVVKVPVHFSRVAQPGMVYLWYAYDWRDYEHSGPATILGSNMNVHEALDPVNEAFAQVWLDRIHAAFVPEPLAISTSLLGNETMWDVLCEVKRAD